MKFIMKAKLLSTLAMIFVLSTGCSTSAKFIVPEGSELEINNRPVVIREDGTVKTKSFSYNAAKGVSYVVLKEGKEIDKGLLETSWGFFKPVWAPFVFANDEYDLTVKSKASATPGVFSKSSRRNACTKPTICATNPASSVG